MTESEHNSVPGATCCAAASDFIITLLTQHAKPRKGKLDFERTVMGPWDVRCFVMNGDSSHTTPGPDGYCPRPHHQTKQSSRYSPLTGKQQSENSALAHWIECGPMNQRVTGSIPSQGTCLGHGPGPQQGACQRQPQVNVSLPFSFPSLQKKKEEEIQKM